MASLPQKPVSSPPLPSEKDDDDRRRQKDDPSSRRISQDDRVYVPPRSGRPVNSYQASYDRSRDEDRYTGRYRERDWDKRDRDHGLRGREDERGHYRRREDAYYARDDRRSHRPSSPRRADRSYRSRSPRSRRPYSPPRYARFRHSRSPPPRKPRTPSRSPRRRRSRSHSRTPQKRKREQSSESAHRRGDIPSLGSSAPIDKRKLPGIRSRSRSTGRRAMDDAKTEPMSLSTDVSKQKLPEPSTSQTRLDIPDNVAKAKHSPVGDREVEQKSFSDRAQHVPELVKDDVRGGQDSGFKARERTPSPPRQPRYMASQPTRDGPYARHNSRSPPRGPRTFARSSLVQSTTNTLPGRRPPPQGALRGHDITTNDTKKTDKAERPNVTAALDAEITRLESHRANLATEYVQLAKNARRALHELDMAMLDLRAAEIRRKVTSNQLEKARAGMLGVDAIATVDSPVI